MDQQNLLQLLRYEGPWGLFVVLFFIACTLWLLISRIRGAFRPQPSRIGRDIAFLFAPPVSAILYTAVQAIVAAQSFVQGGIDAEFPLIYGLNGPVAICTIAFLCFVFGVIAFAFPIKSIDSAKK